MTSPHLMAILVRSPTRSTYRTPWRIPPLLPDEHQASVIYLRYEKNGPSQLACGRVAPSKG